MKIPTKKQSLFKGAISLLCLLFHFAPACATSGEISFTNFSNEPALFQNVIYGITQDNDGYIWLATYNGLIKYDGYTFAPFEDQETHIPFGVVRAVYADSSNHLWLGTNTNGLIYIDLNTNKVVRYSNDPKNSSSLSSNFITSLINDQAGNLWIGSENGGVNLFLPKTKTFKRYNVANGDFPKNFITKIFCANNGDVYTAVYKSNLYKYDKKGDHFHLINTPIDTDALIIDIKQDKQGYYYINSVASVLKYVDLQKQPEVLCGEYPFKHLPLEPIPFGGPLLFDKDKFIWLGSTYNGLSLYNIETKDLKHFPHSNSMSYSLINNHITCLYKDNCGNIWIGTDEGLSKLNYIQRSISILSTINDNPNKNNAAIRAIFKDKANNIWLGTAGDGLQVQYANGKWDKYYCNSRMPNVNFNTINCITEYDNKTLLVGTSLGLQVFDIKQRKFVSSFFWDKGKIGKHENIPIWSIFKDTNDKIWVGTNRYGLILLDIKKGTYEFHNEVFSSIKNPNEAFSIWNIFEDSNRQIWLCTNKGLKKVLYSNQKVISATYTLDKAYDVNIFDITEDKKRYFWLSTSESGLYKFNKSDKSFQHFTTKDGLPTNSISSVICYGDTEIWISSAKGIFNFNTVKNQITASYGVSDGLPENYYNLKSRYYDKESDKLYFGGTGRVCSFSPHDLVGITHNFNTLITAFHVKYELVPIKLIDGSRITLPYSSNDFSFDFTTTDFSNPEKTQYLYKLEGFNDDWINTGNKHAATFTNLSFGSYTFLLKSINRDGTISSKVLKVYIYITPPYWKTWWFYLIVSIATGAILSYILYLIIRRRDARRKLAKSELSALRAQLNPHFIFNCMTSLQHFILSNENNLALPYLNKFARLMRMILENSEKESISLENEVEFLNLYIQMEASRVDHKIDMVISVSEDINTDETHIPPMLLQPVIENSFVHGLLGKKPEGKIKVDFSKANNTIICAVSDNGIGRKKAQANKEKRTFKDKSYGLEITKERLNLMGISYSNNIGLTIKDLTDSLGDSTGTVVIISIPIKNRAENTFLKN